MINVRGNDIDFSNEVDSDPFDTVVNPEPLWNVVSALRSGKYKQGRRQLRNSANEYCILGVFGDVCNKIYGSSIDLDGLTIRALPHICHQFQLKESIVLSFAAYNDSKELSFEKAADLIEFYLTTRGKNGTPR